MLRHYTFHSVVLPFLIPVQQTEQPAWAVSSLGNLALRMCHRSVLFARNPQWTFFTAVNTTWQDFIGMLLEADTPLGTFLTQVSTGTNASLLQFAPPWAKFGSSRSVCLLLLILHKFVLPPLNDSVFNSVWRLGKRDKWTEREKEAEGKVDKKTTEVCVYQAFHSWRTDPGSIDTLRSVGAVWSREASGHWTQISCRKGRIIRELERIFRKQMGGRRRHVWERERERRRTRGSRFGCECQLNAWKCKTKWKRESWVLGGGETEEEREKNEAGRERDSCIGRKMDWEGGRREVNADSSWGEAGDEEIQKLGGG